MAKLTYTGAEVQALLDKVNELVGHKGILLVDGEQVVTGIKNFINGLQVGGKLVKYDTATNAFVFPANAVFEGGVAWNTKLEGFEEQTVTAAVRVDWKTIGKNENGELYVIGGTSGGGGGVVGGVTLDEVKNYLTAEKYTTETWVSSQNYATQSWVTNRGYITGITGSMVTSALGYTPFDSANFTKSKIKSTLGISDWALESVKPSYKFSEITDKPTTLAGYGITDAYTKTQVDSALAKKWTQDDSLIANWSAAYSWGNHALAGYAKQGDVTSELGKYVTLATAQTITGVKDFSNGFKVGGALVTYNASKNAFVFPANAIFEGGIAWNSKLDGFSVPSIMDAIQVDGETISKDKGYLEFIGKAGGGTADSVAWSNITGKPAWIGSSKPNYTFSEISSKPTTLAGYGITDAYTQSQANAKFVDFATNQDITGVKNFVNGAKIGGLLLSYNSTKNAFVIPANVVIEGGVAWNSKLDGFDIPTIMDAVIVDGDTIVKENGVLKVNGDVSGGINETQLGNYLTRNNYAKKSDIPSLSGYATETFVTSRGYITSSAIPTKVSAFTNDASYATESFVTSRGYITSAAISKANIKSILGISDWALAATSPLVNHGKITSATDLTTLTTGLGYTQGYTPVDGTYNYGQLLNFATYRGLTQIYIADGYSSDGRTIHFRNDWNKTGIESRAWHEILSSNSYTKYAMSLTTDQSVTGIKNFVNGFKVGGKLVSYNSDKNAFVLPANLIVEGGIAWYSKLDGFDVPTITNAVKIDNTTIKKNGDSGALEVSADVIARIATLEARIEQLHPTAQV